MSLQIIGQYLTKREQIIRSGGSNKELQIRSAFQSLLIKLCSDKNLELIPELAYKTKFGTPVRPDGTIKTELRQDWGYWESKGSDSSLDDKIQGLIDKGYPTSNILFENGKVAILFQNGQGVGRADIDNPVLFHDLLVLFFSYESNEVASFHEAIEKFKDDLPSLVDRLRKLIEEQATSNLIFTQSINDFLELCQKSINTHMVINDVREMIIQHILTEDIFITVFNEATYHRENNISLQLMKVIQTFFTGDIKRNILNTIDPYYKIIKSAASNIYDHHEKQRFLKVFYETFYRAYNLQAADRLGIIYTPNEIVSFMVNSTEYLLEKYFNRWLCDKNVEILDPVTGTGTFITEIIERIPENQLTYKYDNEMHCNEVAILPYYIANLNIEYTYKQKMGAYREFQNICFVDTLDNLDFGFVGKQHQLPGISTENLGRIQRQNKKDLMIIIGNPPYNANQLNENENNKNRPYPEIDKRIQETYIKHSTAQKTKLYDMYTRFLRWSTERLGEDGIIAFVSNNSFIDARTYDGFRKVVGNEFNVIYIIDLKGNARTSGERRRKEGGNIFSDKIRVGIAIYFLIRKAGLEGCKIYYNAIGDSIKAEDKKAYLQDNELQKLDFGHIIPDKDNNWINLSVLDWDYMIPITSKQSKLAKISEPINSIFKLYSTGISTNRDEWIVDLSVDNLQAKMKFFVDFYTVYSQKNDEWDTSIKWSRNLKQRYRKGLKEAFGHSRIQQFQYRPYGQYNIYYSDLFIDEHGLDQQIAHDENLIISLSGISSSQPFQCLVTRTVPSLDFLEKTQCIPLYRYDKFHKRTDNVTNWSLQQFSEHYKDDCISKEGIFYYVYAVLHHIAYRNKYNMNLRRSSPRIPFYDGFWKWEAWGRQLTELHLNYGTIKPFQLKRVDINVDTTIPTIRLKTILKANKSANFIQIDSATTLENVPSEVWEYKLGNRSAVERILEYYKERKPADATIRDQFNTYRFADYKEQVIELLKRVCTVSAETMKIINEMPED